MGQYFLGSSRRENDGDPFSDRECYVFNRTLERSQDDGRCVHCRHYLTLQCPHISDFMDEEGDVA